MTTYIIRRIFLMIPTLFVITVIIFLLMQLTPGEAWSNLTVGDTPISEGRLEAYIQRFHLDEPIWKRYGYWIWQVIHGNFGISLRRGQSVGQMVFDRLGNTLQLMSFAILVSFIFGLGVGLISGVMQYSLFDYLSTFGIFLALSIPGFFFGFLAIYGFSILIPIFPIGGSISPEIATSTSASFITQLGDRLWHLFLPAVSLGLIFSAYLARFTRTAILETIQEDYITTARAKGLPNIIVLIKHIFRNALIPVITVMSNRLRWLVGGSVAIELVFQYPGVGRLFRDSVRFRDYTVIMTITLFFSLAVIISFLLADLGYALANPKVRYD